VKGDIATVKGDSATPHRKGKATSSSTHVKPKKKVYQPKQGAQKPKKSIWGNPNKYV
jgi:hypothetical protein